MLPRISVVIPTYNRHEPLNRCLAALAAQTCRDFEVIVVDDGSDPPVQSLLTPEFAGSPIVTVLRAPANGGPGRARNLGVAAARGEFVAFIDDDVVADHRLLERHLARAEASHGRLVQFGPLAAPADWRPTPWNLWEARTLEIEYRRMQRGSYSPTWKQFFTGNAFLSKADFLAAGGFDERFTRAEDIELGYRLEKAGGRFAFVPDAVGWHYSDRSLTSWLRIPRDYARFDVVIDALHPEMGWLKHVQRQQKRRHAYTRLAGRILSGLSIETAGVQVAVRIARLTHRVGLHRVTLPVLSFAYAVEYSRALRDATREPGNVVDGRPRSSGNTSTTVESGHAVNAPSTD